MGAAGPFAEGAAAGEGVGADAGAASFVER
jgi:hypothetical protein